MQDGLYLLDKWVAEPEIALTLQANNLTEPSALPSSYTNSATLPDSLDIRSLLDFAEQIDSDTPYPYQLLPAFVIWQGEVVFSGVARLKKFTGGWQVELDENKTNLFDQLADKPIRSLDLSRFNHNWNLSKIQVMNAVPDGVVYPLIDYGAIEEGVVPSDTMYPAVTAKLLLEQMFSESGYKAEGDWLQDGLLNAIAFPFVEEKPSAVDDDWAKARYARVTMTDAPDTKVGGLELLTKFRSLNRIQPFNVDSRFSEGFEDGKQDNYNTTTYTYTADTNMRLTVYAFQAFRAKVTSGAVEVKLIVEVNGAEVAQGYFSKGGPYNTIGPLAKDDKVSVSVSLNLKAKDTAKIRLKVEKRTTFGVMEVIIYNTSATSFASFEPDKTLQYGDTWPVARNLPDLKCFDILSTVAFLTSGIWDVDDVSGTVRLVLLKDTVRLPPEDWSDRITDVEPSWIPAVEPYAQKNYLKWKPTDSVDKDFGDGVINCNAPALKAEETLFTLPFSASMQSTQEIAGYGNPVKIETRTVATSGAGVVTITKKAATPRVILIQPNVNFNVPTKIAGNTPGTTVDSTCALMACWFSVRPKPVVRDENAFSLTFDRVAGQFAEQSLIERYFDGLKMILDKPRTFTATFYLRPADVADLQTPDNNGVKGLMRPVILRGVQVGSLSISQSNFIISQIPNIRNNLPSEVTLIAY